jgi:hypothetical protein
MANTLSWFATTTDWENGIWTSVSVPEGELRNIEDAIDCCKML